MDCSELEIRDFGQRKIALLSAARIVVCRRVSRRFDLRTQYAPASKAAEVRERMEDGLAPRRTSRLRHDRRDRVDQLRETGDFDAVGMIEQRDAHPAEH